MPTRQKKQIRVMVVDDHEVVRSGLAAILATFDDLELVGEAANGQEAVKGCGAARPDVVLMDLLMPIMDGTAATAEICRQLPRTKVIALTSFHEMDLIQAVLRAGAVGYLLKNVSADELAESIRTAYAGHSAMAPEIAEALMHVAVHGRMHSYDLTPREREVLSLMVEGLHNAEIAERLVVSYSTIKFYVSSILAKLGVSSRVEAVAVALQHHLVN